jgi:hypothetical protein
MHSPKNNGSVVSHLAIDDLIRVTEKKMHLLENFHSGRVIAGFGQLSGKPIQGFQDCLERMRFGNHNAPGLTLYISAQAMALQETL